MILRNFALVPMTDPRSQNAMLRLSPNSTVRLADEVNKKWEELGVEVETLTKNPP